MVNRVMEAAVKLSIYPQQFFYTRKIVYQQHPHNLSILLFNYHRNSNTPEVSLVFDVSCLSVVGFSFCHFSTSSIMAYVFD
jgi:hypothetical protein